MGSLRLTVNMKTTFIFLACLLVLTAGYKYSNRHGDYYANLKKKCDNQAVGIASQDCKEQCIVAELGEDCAKCVGTHKDYDYDCKNIGFSVWCGRFLSMKIREEDCKEQCPGEVCGNCIDNHQDYGLSCSLLHHVEANPPPPPPGHL